MSSTSLRKKFTTGVSIEPDVLQYLDQLTTQTNLNRSWVLNAIVREYIRLAHPGDKAPFLSREAIINLN